MQILIISTRTVPVASQWTSVLLMSPKPSLTWPLDRLFWKRYSLVTTLLHNILGGIFEALYHRVLEHFPNYNGEDSWGQHSTLRLSQNLAWGPILVSEEGLQFSLRFFLISGVYILLVWTLYSWFMTLTYHTESLFCGRHRGKYFTHIFFI